MVHAELVVQCGEDLIVSRGRSWNLFEELVIVIIDEALHCILHLSEIKPAYRYNDSTESVVRSTMW